MLLTGKFGRMAAAVVMVIGMLIWRANEGLSTIRWNRFAGFSQGVMWSPGLGLGRMSWIVDLLMRCCCTSRLGNGRGGGVRFGKRM